MEDQDINHHLGSLTRAESQSATSQGQTMVITGGGMEREHIDSSGLEKGRE